MTRTWCSEMTLQDLTVLASLRNTKINRTSLPRLSLLPDLSPIKHMWEQARLTCLKLRTSQIETILNFARLLQGLDRISCLERMYPLNLMMKMFQVVIQQSEGYTQHKLEVVDIFEPFRDFLHKRS